MAEGTPPRESARAAWCFEQYCRLGPQRSIQRLAADLRRRRDVGEVSVELTVRQLERYSRTFSWPARAAAFDHDQDLRRRAAYEAAQQQQAEADVKLAQDTLRGQLAVAARILASYVDADGSLAKDATLKDVAALTKGALDGLRLLSGQPTTIIGLTDRERLLERYKMSDHETQAAITAGLKALRRLHQADDE